MHEGRQNGRNHGRTIRNVTVPHAARKVYASGSIKIEGKLSGKKVTVENNNLTSNGKFITFEGKFKVR